MELSTSGSGSDPCSKSPVDSCGGYSSKTTSVRAYREFLRNTLHYPPLECGLAAGVVVGDAPQCMRNSERRLVTPIQPLPLRRTTGDLTGAQDRRAFEVIRDAENGSNLLYSKHVTMVRRSGQNAILTTFRQKRAAKSLIPRYPKNAIVVRIDHFKAFSVDRSAITLGGRSAPDRKDLGTESQPRLVDRRAGPRFTSVGHLLDSSGCSAGILNSSSVRISGVHLERQICPNLSICSPNHQERAVLVSIRRSKPPTTKATGCSYEHRPVHQIGSDFVRRTGSHQLPQEQQSRTFTHWVAVCNARWNCLDLKRIRGCPGFQSYAIAVGSYKKGECATASGLNGLVHRRH